MIAVAARGARIGGEPMAAQAPATAGLDRQP
jgi:hypothetical protein